GFRNEADVLFNCVPAYELTLRVLDENDRPTTGSFLIRDARGRVYPAQAKRLPPDFAFHPQIYRGDGETLKLPPGTYTVEFSRGPESVPQTQTLNIEQTSQSSTFKVKRW